MIRFVFFSVAVLLTSVANECVVLRLDFAPGTLNARLSDMSRPGTERLPCAFFFDYYTPEYRRLWLRQNRLGGLKDSLAILFGL